MNWCFLPPVAYPCLWQQWILATPFAKHEWPSGSLEDELPFREWCHRDFMFSLGRAQRFHLDDQTQSKHSLASLEIGRMEQESYKMGLLMNYTPYQKPVLHLHALGSSYKKSLHDDPSESLSILGSLVRTPSLRGRNRSGFVGPLVTGRTASHPSHFGVPYQVDANHRSTSSSVTGNCASEIRQERRPI